MTRVDTAIEEITNHLRVLLKETVESSRVSNNFTPLTVGKTMSTMYRAIGSTLGIHANLKPEVVGQEAPPLPKYIKLQKLWETLGTCFHHVARQQHVGNTVFNSNALQVLEQCFFNVLLGDFPNSIEVYLLGQLPTFSIHCVVDGESPMQVSTSSSQKCYVATIYDIMQYMYRFNKGFFALVQDSYSVNYNIELRQIDFKFAPSRELRSLVDGAFLGCGREATAEELLEISSLH